MRPISFIISFLSGIAGFLPFAHSQVITTVAGIAGLSGTSGDGGPATLALLDNPLVIYVDRSGSIYCTTNSGRIRMVNPAGMMSTIVGNGTTAYSGDGGAATAAGIEMPRSVLVDRLGNIYLCEAKITLDGTSYIRKVNTAGIITTIAGNGTAGFSGDGGPATNASFRTVRDIALDTAGNIYLTDVVNNRIRKINTSGIITTVAGIGTPGFSGDAGPATGAQLHGPCSVAVDSAGNIYIADNGNQRIRMVNASGIITTIAGTGFAGFTGDGGPGTAAKISNPGAVRVDAYGGIVFGDSYNHRVRRIDPSGIINTIAGNGTPGHIGDCGPATAAELSAPGGIAIDHYGNIFVCDAVDENIRKIYAAGITDITGPANLCSGLTSVLTDSTHFGVWRSSDTAIATIDSISGIVTGRSGGAAVISYFFNGCFVADTFVVNPVPSPGSITGVDSLCPGDTATLHETVPGGVWASSNSAIAGVSSVGLTTALLSGTDTIRYTVTVAGCQAVASFPLVVRPSAQCPNSIKDFSNLQGHGFSIHPNPSRGSVTITIPPSALPTLITITDITGRKIEETTTTTKQTDLRLHQPGLYFITVTTDTGRWTEKVVVY